MSLVTSIQALLKRPLSTDEVQSLNAFQKQFEVDDDDPLMVVLAMMARSQIILEAAPILLQQKVNETIELHRTALRDQAVIIAKDLVGLLAKDVLNQHSLDLELSIVKKYRTRWINYAITFLAGVSVALCFVALTKYLSQNSFQIGRFLSF